MTKKKVGRPKCRIEKKPVCLRISRKGRYHQRLRQLAAEKDITMGELIELMIDRMWGRRK